MATVRGMATREPRDAGNFAKSGGERTTWLPAMLLHDTVRNQVTVTSPNRGLIPGADPRSVPAWRHYWPPPASARR